MSIFERHEDCDHGHVEVTRYGIRCAQCGLILKMAGERTEAERREARNRAARRARKARKVREDCQLYGFAAVDMTTGERVDPRDLRP